MLGYTVTIFAHVGLTSQAETDLARFEQMVGEWPEVRECHMLMGEADFLLKIVARDWDAFQRFLTSRLTPAPLVSRSEEHTSELQSLMRNSYAVFCLKKKKI